VRDLHAVRAARDPEGERGLPIAAGGVPLGELDVVGGGEARRELHGEALPDLVPVVHRRAREDLAAPLVAGLRLAIALPHLEPAPAVPDRQPLGQALQSVELGRISGIEVAGEERRRRGGEGPPAPAQLVGRAPKQLSREAPGASSSPQSR
jgi:hypothetical protein